MRKRKELDALVGGVGVKRSNGGNKRPGSGGVSPQDQLLSESTGEEEYWSSTKGGNCGKGRRHYNSTSSKRKSHACTALLRLCTILLVMACLVATITVMWLFIDIKEQTTYLRSQLDQVSAGNEGIPDAIQKCHNLTSELKNNQTEIIAQLQQVAQRLMNFSNMISGIQSGLLNVEKKLNDSPELVTIPKTVKSLMSSVASIGGQLNDFNITTIKVFNEQKKISDQIQIINKNLSSYYDDIQEQRNSTVLIKELKDEINNCKLHINTIESGHSNQIKLVEGYQNQTEKEFNECKELVKNFDLQVSNISSKLSNCIDICHNNISAANSSSSGNSHLPEPSDNSSNSMSLA